MASRTEQTTEELNQTSRSLDQVVQVLRTTSTAVGQVAQSVSSAGKAAAAAAKTAKGIKGQIRDLFSFDQINRLSSVTASGGSSKSSGGSRRSSGGSSDGRGGGSAAIQETVSWLDKLKQLLGQLVQPLQNFWNQNGGNTLKAFRTLTQAAGELAGLLRGALSWGYENVLVPLGKWTLNSLAPAVLNDLAAAVRVVSGVLRVLQPIALGIWNQVLKPLGAWTGARLVDALNLLGGLLNGLADGLNGLAEFIGSGSILSKVESFGGKVVQSIGNGIGQAKESLKTTVQGLLQKITGEVSVLSNLNPVKLAVQLGTAAAKLWESLKAAWNSLGAKVSVDNRLSKTASTLWGTFKASWGSRAVSIGNSLSKSGATLWSTFKASWGSRSVSIGNSLSKKASTLWSSFKSSWGTRTVSIRNTLSSSASSLWSGFKRGWSGKTLSIKLTYVTQGISSLQRIAYRALGLSGWPKLTFAARGGVFAGPTLTMLGEAGTEAVVPLERNTGWIDRLAERLARSQSGTVQEGTGQTITVNCVLDGSVIARNTIQYINGRARTTGVNPLSAYL